MIQFLVLAILAFGKVSSLTGEKVPRYLEKNTKSIVKFYAPWCKHCKSLAPEYEEAAKLIESILPAAEIDSSAEKIVNEVFKIKGYPTIAVIENNTVYQYGGKRSTSRIVKWVESGEYLKSEDQFKLSKKDIAKLLTKPSKPATPVDPTPKADRKNATLPVTELKKVGENATVPQTQLKKAGENATLPQTQLKKAKEYSTLPVTQLKKAAEYSTLPATQLKKAAEYSTLPATQLKKAAVAPPTDMTNVAGKHATLPVTQLKKVGKDATLPVTELVKAASGSEPVKKGIQAVKLHELDEVKFEEVTQASSGSTTGSWMVMFYAPWCGHCQRMKPEFEKLADKLQEEHNDLMLAKVNCDQNRTLCTRYEVKGFPTILLLKNGVMYKYKNARNADSMLNWYISGDYAGAENLPIPKPETMLSRATRMLHELSYQVEDVMAGIRTRSLIGFAAAIITFVVLLYFCLMSATKTDTRKDKQK